MQLHRSFCSTRARRAVVSLRYCWITVTCIASNLSVVSRLCHWELVQKEGGYFVPVNLKELSALRKDFPQYPSIHATLGQHLAVGGASASQTMSSGCGDPLLYGDDLDAPYKIV
eukprot:gb/GECG01007139.1/.p1 GENE.gb/GECG01007139.1/~~gb/GECG01007139.1/.p1  ORF type:complete len:114 (+),score=11.65 gb/GECG01007139.1/:1-342(+)